MTQSDADMIKEIRGLLAVQQDAPTRNVAFMQPLHDALRNNADRLLDLAEAGEKMQAERDAVVFDLHATLRSVLHNWGPEGASNVTGQVLLARKSRDTNAEIDDLERILAQEPKP